MHLNVNLDVFRCRWIYYIESALRYAVCGTTYILSNFGFERLRLIESYGTRFLSLWHTKAVLQQSHVTLFILDIVCVCVLGIVQTSDSDAVDIQHRFGGEIVSCDALFLCWIKPGKDNKHMPCMRQGTELHSTTAFPSHIHTHTFSTSTPNSSGIAVHFFLLLQLICGYGGRNDINAAILSLSVSRVWLTLVTYLYIDATSIYMFDNNNNSYSSISNLRCDRVMNVIAEHFV